MYSLRVIDDDSASEHCDTNDNGKLRHYFVWSCDHLLVYPLTSVYDMHRPTIHAMNGASKMEATIS